MKAMKDGGVDIEYVGRTVEAVWNSRTDTYELHVDPIHAWSDDGDNWMDYDQCEPFPFDRYPYVSIRLVGGPRAGVTVG